MESQSGKRIAVDYTNVIRSSPMVVYYDYQFGAKTGTNIFGTEMTCVYNFETNTFEVKSFRGFGTGDDSGSEIPDNSFVLSAYGEGYRQLLVKNELFREGPLYKPKNLNTYCASAHGKDSKEDEGVRGRRREGE